MTLIKQEDAIETVQQYLDILIWSRRHGDDFTFINTLTEVRNAINSLPSAEAPPYCVLGQRPPWSEPRTWHEKNSHTYICGDCGFEQAIYGNINEYNCCPRCGIYKEYVDFGGIFPKERTPYREESEVEE